MTHGDDDGLVLPPKIAPVQVQIVSAVNDNDRVKENVSLLAGELEKAGIRVKTDLRDGYSLGWKLNDAEIQGVPLTVVVGEKEIDSAQLSVKFRHSGEKRTVAWDVFAESLVTYLDEIQQQLFQKAVAQRDALLHEVATYEEFRDVMAKTRGFIKAFWCEQTECEKSIKEETKASTRCLPFTDAKGSVAEETGTCVKCGQPATHRWLFAQAY